MTFMPPLQRLHRERPRLLEATPKSSSPSSAHGGCSTPSAAGPHSTSVRWIASA